MFKRQAAILFIFLLLLAAGTIFLFYQALPNAKNVYHLLMHNCNHAAKILLSEESDSTQQARRQISKQILYTQGAHRLQSRLEGISSDLVYSKKKGEFSECIQGLSCEMQGGQGLIVDSGEAKYDGKEIHLTGNVAVEHNLGKISSHRLTIQPSTEKKKNLELLKISDDVKIAFSGGGELTCQIGEVDYAKMSGFFLGNSEQPDVCYFNRGEKKEGLFHIPTPFELKSKHICIELEEGAPELKETTIKRLIANQNVRIGYNQDYQLLADRVTYHPLHHSSDQKTPADRDLSLEGRLNLYSGPELSACHLTNASGDQLFAEEIQIDTQERLLTCKNAKGTIVSNNLLTTFSSDTLIWDDQLQTILLKGNAALLYEGVMQLSANDQLLIILSKNKGKRDLRAIQAEKGSQISYKSPKCTLYCPGQLYIDHERKEILFNGYHIENKKQQVFIDEEFGEMYADRLQIEYSLNEGEMTPEKIILEGDVCLKNYYEKHAGKTGSPLHYAIADKMEYFPSLNELILTSTASRRVLLFDKANNMHMSAPCLNIINNPLTGKPTIHANGDARFTFIENEFEQFNQRFSLIESTKGRKNAKE